MGATGWSYFVPYQSDINAALQHLRNDVFNRGEYVEGSAVSPQELRTTAQEFVPKLDEWLKQCHEQAVNLPDHLRGPFLQEAMDFKKQMIDYASGNVPESKTPKAKTIKQLIKQQADTGTHSILDIDRVSDEPGFGGITKLKDEHLQALFQTTQPTHQQIEDAYGSEEFENHLSERWEGIYIVAYENGAPKEIFFAGCSGD